MLHLCAVRFKMNKHVFHVPAICASCGRSLWFVLVHLRFVDLSKQFHSHSPASPTPRIALPWQPD